jgi:hypothetical protein
MAATSINPASRPRDVDRGPGGGNVLRSSDTWNLVSRRRLLVISAGFNGGDSTTNVDFLDINGDTPARLV